MHTVRQFATTATLFLLSILCIPGACRFSTDKHSTGTNLQSEDWREYGGNKAGNRYSHLSQINLNNIKNLQVAWTYNSDSSIGQLQGMRSSEMECQPIVVNGVLY